jgi:hypothetical protein
LMPLARQSAIYVPPPVSPSFLQQRDLKAPPSRPTASRLSVASNRLSSPPPAMTPARSPRQSVPPVPASDESSLIPAARPAVDSRAIALARLTPEALPATPSPRLPLMEKLRRKLLFWRTWTDAVACTLLTPGALSPGETTTIQVVLHNSDRSAQAKTLPDWRGTQPIPEQLGRGESVGLHLRLQGVDVPKPLATVEWNGYSAAALFTVRIPVDWSAGPAAQGSLLIGRHQLPIGKVEFTVRITTPQPAV